LIKKIVGFAERLTPIALVGTGGIDNTPATFTVPRDDRFKKPFGDDHRFTHRDKFPTFLTHFPRRRSKTVGACIENPEDLTPLRPFLSSQNVSIVLDNAEPVLDPLATGAQEIYTVAEELYPLSNIYLSLTSLTSTLPVAGRPNAIEGGRMRYLPLRVFRIDRQHPETARLARDVDRPTCHGSGTGVAQAYITTRVSQSPLDHGTPYHFRLTCFKNLARTFRRIS